MRELTWIDAAKEWVFTKAPGFAVDLAVFLLLIFVGYLLIGAVRRMLRLTLERSKQLNEMLIAFTVSVIGKTLWVIVLMMALPRLGIDVAPLVAGLGVTGFVFGFAFQESLANLAAGVMLMVNQPFQIGDVVEAGGCKGKVAELNLMATELLTPDNRRVVIPNRTLWGSTITNDTVEFNRRVDLGVGISYSDDIGVALGVLQELCKRHPLVLDQPATTCEVNNLGDSSVDLVVRPWVKTRDYWPVYYSLTREIKEALDEAGIEIPFPQRVIHEA